MTAINIKTLGRSSITGGLAQVWRILSRFILTPIIIGSIGLPGYGAWTLVFSVAAYVQMTNASLGMAYTKFTAECVRHRRYDELTHIIGSGMAGVGVLGLVGLAAAWLFGEPLMRALNVPPDLVADAALALTIVVATIVLRMTIGSTLEVLAGLQRIDLTYRLTVVASIIDFAITLPLLLLGHGLLGLAIGHAAGQITIHLAAYTMVRRRLPQVRLSPRYISRDGMHKILSVGGRFQLLSVVNTVVSSGVKMLISGLVGVEWLAIYELADKLMSLGKTASEAVVAPLMPAFASLQAGGDRIRERLLFLKGSKADALFGGASFTFLALLAPALLLMWTGEDVPEAAWVLRVLAIPEATMLLTSVVSSSLRAQGRVRLEFTWAMISTVVFAALVVPLAPWLGFEGVIYARIIAQLVGTTWYLRAYFGFAQMSWGEYLRGTRIPLLAVLLASVSAVVWTARALLSTPIPPGLSARWGAVFEVVVWGVPFVVLLGVSVWKIYLEAEDRQQIRALVTAIIDRIRGRNQAPELDVLIVTTASPEDTASLLEAAQVLGNVEASTPQGASGLLTGGIAVRLVLVQLDDDSDVEEQWAWLEQARPDLVERVAYVGGEDLPFFEDHGLRRYPTVPDSETLRADWGPPASADPDAQTAD